MLKLQLHPTAGPRTQENTYANIVDTHVYGYGLIPACSDWIGGARYLV